MFIPEILIPACDSSSPAFLLMYSTYKLNKQGDNIQSTCTPFPTLNSLLLVLPKKCDFDLDVKQPVFYWWYKKT